jgi:mannose-6-phosphate isomerase-like protein (cupin superfamily)
MGAGSMTQVAGGERKPFEIYRASDQLDYAEHQIQKMVDPPPAALEALGDFATEGSASGQHVTLAYARPGISLTRVWFKSGYPLPLHSHSADCLYFIVAGSLTMGTETLGPGDGFFLGTDVPYTYVPGSEGVEVLEFRTSSHFDFKALGKTKAYWDRAVEDMRAARENWHRETVPPSGINVG